MAYPAGYIELNDKRDVPLLKEVLHAGYVTHAQLFELMQFAGVECCRKAFNWRVKRLVTQELLLRHESGVLSSVHLNFVQRDYRRTCQVIGTEGTIYWDFQSNRVDIYGADGQLRSYLPNLPDWQLNEMYIDELAQFTGRVSSRRPTINPVATALKTLELALAARIS